MTTTIRFGSEDITRPFPDGTTIAGVVSNPEIRMTLGYGDNVKALVAGVEQSLQAIAPDGGIIVVETKANDKATA